MYAAPECGPDHDPELQRFARADKRAKLPRWINQYITDTVSNLSTDMAIVLSKLFMRSISQNVNENQTGISLWTLEDVQKAQEKQKAMIAEAEAERERLAAANGRAAGGATGVALDDDDDEFDFSDSELAALGL